MSSDVGSDGADWAGRLAVLRREMTARGLDGFVVPMADRYQNEYIPAAARRIAWLTGFTGSAGLVVVLAETAAAFTDGRYTLQIADQVDGDLYERLHSGETPPPDWIARNLPSGGKLGFDSWLFTQDGVARIRKGAEAAGGELIAVEDNPLDAVWHDQPDEPMALVVPHDIAFAGESSADKRGRLAAALRGSGREAVVITAPDSIAWLLNIRGGDVPHSPLPLSLAILHGDGQVDLFLDPEKRGRGPGLALAKHLGNEVSLQLPDAFAPALDALKDKVVQADPGSTAAWVFERLTAAGAEIARDTDPCQLPKAIKNEVELQGARAAHGRDGAAMVRFQHWLSVFGPKGDLDELAVEAQLEKFRRDGEHFRDLSFPTITGSGPNGAIVHYRVTAASNRKLGTGEFYLVDSGAQYLDGTTDVTRTIAIGMVSDEMRDRFTRVLKGHIAIATTRFPIGTTGAQLDTLARHALWQVGLDFDHGTGHGVGSYLNVHEGPHSISKRQQTQDLRPGMVVSNEPGYYKTGAFGIRIENLLAVREAGIAGAERDMLEFESLTLAPIDRNAILPELLSEPEKAWLNAYHQRVYDAISPQIDDPSREWLDEATRPI
ncbi:MAG: aminopeptidase P family protein [Alphaproteobacteria bacterium]|nr:X-Pro aminopeptidase [Rhodospirillaceae bacterium]MDP6020640.1 aminopeptidase P family protein [Alphaproteobacteria bacterium]MDP6256638.1 aminopeptidase P family protein [Alphaproteobacteria bacterium]MDP7054697.1 aminopeptidase P family protein [Alphaproteobacteria bacterium]MDP7229657.1 aminopeptidase P family protein [Alphaproteobacteria bacterium]|tara:strand:- start:4776 stop:6590 length:1815 start_codon:yes stop_codon:yes gene_type:complete